MKTKKQFKWFWAWDDTKEEIWMREMSQKGWHFKSVTTPGNFIFEQGEPTDYVYRLDYFTNTEDTANYLQIFEDAGWEYMGRMSGWQYFRQEAVEGQELEIFTDYTSKARKYQRIMMLMATLFPVSFISIVLINQGSDSDIIQAISIVMGILMIFYVYAMTRLLGMIVTMLKK